MYRIEEEILWQKENGHMKKLKSIEEHTTNLYSISIKMILILLFLKQLDLEEQTTGRIQSYG
jgi:hypothetical protein